MTEILVCDTSVVSHLFRRRSQPDRYAGWGSVSRLRGSVLAISVVTVAESRAGFLIDHWGLRKTCTANRMLEGFLQIPVDRSALDEWARLRAAARARGIAISDNDLWIAATASVREQVLVTCDRDHQRIAPELPVDVVFLVPPV
ncbi:MAG TPA: PIN domain-containing protein [Solirubrobacterales bacterium]|jgi:predicted nucleic acid-binding protein|nr:PIN domain-containing protein [Solirubrobacterales bacterium]